jgi:serine/threonine protein kinase
MPHQYQCQQGHAWAYGDAEIARVGTPLFCPTCGLRLYTESQLATMTVTVPIQPLLPSNYESTPMSNVDIWRLNRQSADGLVAAPTIQPNDIEAIPGYELLGILGRGGMGIVFRARQLSLKRQVALKMILTGRHARPSERSRFQREAEAVARLHHANIVQIYEVGEQNGLPYCALEFVNAGSLAQFLGGVPQPPRISGQFVHDLAQAMHYAHKRGIVHRDLKPANILLQLDESTLLKDGHLSDTAVFRNLTSYVPKITDFGLAKHMGGEEGPIRFGAMLGTPSYMAPEQARGTSGEVGPAADVYALGAILYEMLTGRPPFRAATVDDTAQQVLTQEPIPPTQLQPKTPKDLETICLVCLQKNASHRYGSAEALAEDLRRFLLHEPILARQTHLSERAIKFAIRRPLLVTFGLGSSILTLLLWWSWWERAIAFQVEREEIILGWQQSDDQLQLAMQAIDHMVDAADSPLSPDSKGGAPPATLLKAKHLYETLLEVDGPPARTALLYYRLGKVHERLGDQRAAQEAYHAAIQRWEKLSEEDARPGDYKRHLLDGRQRILSLQNAARP